MIVVTTDGIPGMHLHLLGLVQGSVVQSKHMGKDMMAGFKTIVGGEIKGYTEMLDESRGIAMNRMIEQAQQMGADAIVAVRFGSAAAMQGAAEMLCYGTAVKFIQPNQPA